MMGAQPLYLSLGFSVAGTARGQARVGDRDVDVLFVERFLKEVPSVQAEAVIADRIVGKPYLEIDIDREAIARYGLAVRDVQDVIEIAVGGRTVTTTVEGRERYPVRVRYAQPC